MAMIIPLKRDVEPACNDAAGLQGDAGGSADIILFPGIRYERWSDDHDGRACELQRAANDRAAVRDWLEI